MLSNAMFLITNFGQTSIGNTRGTPWKVEMLTNGMFLINVNWVTLLNMKFPGKSVLLGMYCVYILSLFLVSMAHVVV